LTAKNYFLPIIAVLFLVVVYFFNSALQPLYADEPTRALCTLEMIISDNWIPTINGETYLNKPPLYNWILIPFFKVFGFKEWVVRLPAIISFLLLGLLVYYFNFKITRQFLPSFFTSMAVLTAGNILFYSSLLGHIDALFSVIIFSSFMLAYLLASDKKWAILFSITYLLCFVGFMLKGIPAIVFQGFTLLTAAFFFKAWKQFVSLKHVLASLWFILPTALYLYAFSQEFPILDFINNLWEESSKRTVIQKSFWEGVKHIISFPFQFIIDTSPWSLLLFIFIDKDLRDVVKKNTFLRFCFLLFLTNVLVYWLSPDNRARYVLMLYPLFFTIIFVALFQIKKNNLSDWINGAFKIPAYLFPFIIILAAYYYQSYLQFYTLELLLVFALALILLFFAFYKKSDGLMLMIFLLCTIRLGMDIIIIPERIKTSEYTREKNEAHEIANITKGKSLSMYCSNLHHNSTFYITLARFELLKIKTKPSQYQKDEFYLIPKTLITDSLNTTYYYSFVRRFGNMPFALVKFNNEFPRSLK
jgi:4-amino-4-deoxy-L-arabinose transferase-like glycosyltransferase